MRRGHIERYNANIETKYPDARIPKGRHRYYDCGERRWFGLVALEHLRLTAEGTACLAEYRLLKGRHHGADRTEHGEGKPIPMEIHYYDHSVNVQGDVQGSNLASGASTITGSSASCNTTEELVEALKALTPLIRSATECQENTVTRAIEVLIRAAGDPSVPATDVKRAALVVASSSPTLKQRLGDLAGRIGTSLTGAAIFQGIKMALGIH
jgi:hypothetical protein